jgi:hypothetical protein
MYMCEQPLLTILCVNILTTVTRNRESFLVALSNIQIVCNIIINIITLSYFWHQN